jgi:L-alanine-DL-glutamate epimerase-like enolase superfamily enzyme
MDTLRVYADVFHVPTTEETVHRLTPVAKQGYTSVKTEVHLTKEGRILRDNELVRENVEMVKTLRRA